MIALDIITGQFICNEKKALFAYLTAAYRMGHLYIQLQDDTIAPYIDEFFEGAAPSVTQIVDEFRAVIAEQKQSAYYTCQGTKLYLARAFLVKESIQAHLTRLQQAPSSFSCNIEAAREYLSSESLEPEQIEAILHALQSPVASIWGGPGTGKTYTAGRLLKVILEFSDRALRCILTAPTGKAAATIAKSIQSARATAEKEFEAVTLHSLLQIRPLGTVRKRGDFLPYDIIIVDESSMVDSSLFEKLLSRIASGSKLIMLGDPDQLPPVEPGAPFHDFIESVTVSGSSQGRLSRCLRAELQTLVHFSALIRDGKSREAIDFAKEAEGISLHYFEEAELESHIQKTLPNHLATILSPMRVGRFGTEAINRLLQERHTGKSLPIIMMQNDYELGLVNGQIGRLEGDFAYFETIKGIRSIPRILLGPFQPAFCLSVHKSQGSEFDEVLLLLPPGSERFGKKMLYTAVTRTKKKLHIWTCQAVLQACIEL